MSVYDWPPKQIELAPPISSSWQYRLDNIGGKAPNGMSMLKLEWGGTARWTKTTKELKYLHHRQDRQTGWRIPILDAKGEVIKYVTYSFRPGFPPPVLGDRQGIASPIMVNEEIGIPRWWITQYIPPSLIGDWAAARRRVMSQVGNFADMGERPNEGMYYLGFHGIWDHEGRKCCALATKERRKCFGNYREPSDLDLLYVASVWREMSECQDLHSWMEPADDKSMVRLLEQRAAAQQKLEKADYESMRLRIKDAFTTHKATLTARKGKTDFIFTKFGTN